MNYKTLLKEAEVRTFTLKDLTMPSLPKDGTEFFLKEIARRYAKDLAAFFRKDRFTETLEVSSHNSASSVWYSDRQIRLLIWPGDLTIEGDLIDDDFSLDPMLIVHGNLTLRNWLHGGMGAFVGGNVKASGFIIGYYNDSSLFVGGDLIAAGYIPRIKPYPDIPKVWPHQVAGKIRAKTFDNRETTNEQLQATFVPEALTKDGEDIYIDEHAIMARATAGQQVWK